jgi:hypothetical protein
MVVDMTDTFEEACRSADEKAVAAPKKAEDWLAAFSKKSNEALAAKAAEKKIAPPPDEVALVQALACKTDIEYDKVRSEVAETLGIRVSTLDDKVTARREAMDADEKVGPAHWNVAPAAAPVDGAEITRSAACRFPPLHHAATRRRRRPAAMGLARLDT